MNVRVHAGIAEETAELIPFTAPNDGQMRDRLAPCSGCHRHAGASCGLRVPTDDGSPALVQLVDPAKANA
jgi:hypothetical protein